jgi:hypothetical protein
MRTWKDIVNDEFDPFNWNEVTNIYTTSGKITVQRGCNGYTATNIGDTPVRINGKVLFPSATPLTVLGDSISLGGNRGEIYKGQIIVMFATPLGALPQVEIIQKFYTKFE